MVKYSKILGSVAVGAAILTAFGAQEARSATCVASDGGCVQTGSVEPGGTWLGNIAGQPSVSDIANFKMAAGEITDTSQAIYLGKVEESADTAPLFDVDSIGATSGTFQYTGTGTISVLNVILKFDHIDAPVYQLTDVMNLDSFSWTTDGKHALSNIQFVSAVPIPAALPLLLTALGGLGLIGRRKLTSASA